MVKHCVKNYNFQFDNTGCNLMPQGIRDVFPDVLSTGPRQCLAKVGELGLKVFDICEIIMTCRTFHFIFQLY